MPKDRAQSRHGFPLVSRAGKVTDISAVGFTLIEMMVVLGILVIILASAVPVFNALTGTHSQAAAQNQVAAMLGTARADAIYYRQITGIFFFVDPGTGQVAMAEVQADPQTGGGTTYTPTNVSPINGPAPADGAVQALELANYYTPPSPAAPAATPGTFTYFRDLVLLPTNIGVALNNNYYGYIYNPAAPPPAGCAFDRYLRLGAILFDANGMVTTVPFAVQQIRLTPYSTSSGAPVRPVNQLGRRLGLHGILPTNPTPSGDLASIMSPTLAPPPPNPPAIPVYPLSSQVGLLFYDRDAFLNQKTTNAATPGVAFTDADLEYQLPGQTAATASNKSDEETWLDQNGVAVLINPNNGSFIYAK